MCYGCGYNLKDHFDQLRKQEQAEKERAQRIRNAIQKDVQSVSKGNAESSSSASSTIGTTIKIVSIIVLVLCVIGSLVVIGESFAIGLAILIVSVLFGLLSFGIGEIICLLQEIKARIR
jgi:uncharacterized membrane protein YkgB